MVTFALLSITKVGVFTNAVEATFSIATVGILITIMESSDTFINI